MNIKNSDKTKEYYNAISKGYKELYHDEQIEKINLVKKYIPETGTILDLGSGDGVLNEFIDLNKCNLVSLDLSFNMLKRNVNENKILADCSFNLPFKSGSFDTVFSFSVLQDLNDPSLAIQEISRISKTNSMVIISFIKQSSKKNVLFKLLEKNFTKIKMIEEKKDYIFILKKCVENKKKN